MDKLILSELTNGLNTVWMLLAAMLVFFMQPGFALVEAGFTRVKNTANILMKNFVDFMFGSLLYWFIGFGLMFGAGGFIGMPHFFDLSFYDGGGLPTEGFLVFQTVFCATAATIFLGLSVGATMTAEAFLNWTTIGIVIGGFLAFALSITGGIFFVKLVNLFSKKKINPLIGATGLSAVPMASRVANEIALKYDPKNHVLQYCMASNISGVIGSAVAAGVLISFLA